MQHQAMLMYTSCGWFFSDVSGLEPQQILRYAGRVIDFIRELGHKSPLDDFLDRLAHAKSNFPDRGNAADIFRRHVVSARVSPRRMSAHIAISELVRRQSQSDELRSSRPKTKSPPLGSAHHEGEEAGYQYVCDHLQRKSHGTVQMLTARIQLTRQVTGRHYTESVAALHLGGVDFYCVVDSEKDEPTFLTAVQRLWGAFQNSPLPILLRIAAEELGQREYGLEHLLPEEAHWVSERIMGKLLQRFSEQYAFLYEDHRRTLDMLKSAGFAVPKELTAAAEFTLGRRFEQEILRQRESQDPNAYLEAVAIAEEAFEHGYHLDQTAARRTFESMVTHAVQIAMAHHDPKDIATAIQLLALAKRLRLGLDLQRAQESVYAMVIKKKHEIPQLTELMAALHLSPHAGS